MASWDGKIPFDEDGQPEEWDYGYERRDNDPFSAIAYFIGFGRGRSAAYGRFRFPRQGWDDVKMFLSSLDDFVAAHGLPPEGTPIVGTWQFEKRGRDYGIRWCGWPSRGADGGDLMFAHAAVFGYSGKSGERIGHQYPPELGDDDD